jgi:hypothetical protein
MFLLLQNNYFHRRNGFRQFWESLKWFGALYEFFKNFLWFTWWLPVVPPLHLINIFKKMFLFVQNNCFDERHGFRQFSEMFEVSWGIF